MKVLGVLLLLFVMMGVLLLLFVMMGVLLLLVVMMNDGRFTPVGCFEL